jgi:uncharacterized protein YihD (DUF1040 family)
MSSVEDQAAYQRKRAELYRLFEAGEGDDESPASMDGALKELIIDCVALQHDLDASDPSMRRKIWKWAMGKMGDWDPNDPALAHSAKMLRLLPANLDGSTTAYAEDLQLHRQQEESARQAKRASNPHRKHQLDEILERWVKREPDLGTAEALERLRDHEGYGGVIEVTEEDIEFYPFEDSEKKQQIKKVKKAGLGSRLTRIRNAMKRVQ